MGKLTQIDKPKRLGYSGYMNEKSKAAAMLGKLGGSAVSKVKAEAARENGKLGGRPRKDKQKMICLTCDKRWNESLQDGERVKMDVVNKRGGGAFIGDRELRCPKCKGTDVDRN